MKNKQKMVQRKDRSLVKKIRNFETHMAHLRNKSIILNVVDENDEVCDMVKNIQNDHNYCIARSCHEDHSYSLNVNIPKDTHKDTSSYNDLAIGNY